MQTQSAGAAHRPLDGVRVADFTGYLPGAFATQLLADLGADVLKIEGYPEGDYARGMKPASGFLSINRNKRSLQFDLRRPEGQEAARQVSASCDVVVESFRPGAMRAMQLDYPVLAALRPDIIYCSISAYGQFGPWSQLPAHGYNIDAAAGFLQVGVDADGRPFTPPSAQLMPASILGAHAAALGIAAALYRRRLTGEGGHIDASCWDSAIAGDPIGSAGTASDDAMAPGFGSPDTPKYAPYRTSDNRYVMLCLIETKYWKTFCQCVGRPDLIDAVASGHEGDLGEGNSRIYREVSAIIAGRSLSEWSQLFAQAAIPAVPILSRREAIDSEHGTIRGIVTPLTGETRAYARFPLLFDGIIPPPGTPPPELGAHTLEVLTQLGLPASTQGPDGLRDEGGQHAG